MSGSNAINQPRTLLDNTIEALKEDTLDAVASALTFSRTNLTPQADTADPAPHKDSLHLPQHLAMALPLEEQAALLEAKAEPSETMGFYVTDLLCQLWDAGRNAWDYLSFDFSRLPRYGTVLFSSTFSPLQIQCVLYITVLRMSHG